MKKIVFTSIILISLIGIGYLVFYTGLLNRKSNKEIIITENQNTSINIPDSVYTDEILPAKQEALLYVEEESTEHYTYYLVTGSFSKKVNAETYKTSLESKGYQANIIRSDFDHYKVSIFSSTNKKEALDSLMNARKIEEFESAWLLKRKRN